ncbi:hypothetical protein F4678DRAFT_477578 [Xylaria arbuscula]|nr:hypothetical protein F4678DRAFT_477578 [Xylaria arbuscula]
MPSTPESSWTLPQARHISYLTLRILYEKNITQRTVEWFLNALWPEGISQAICQLLDVQPVTLLDEATECRIACREQREQAIREGLVQQILDTNHITPAILKGLVTALDASPLPCDRTTKHYVKAQWTLRGSPPVSTNHYDIPCTSTIGNAIKPQTSSAIRKAFVQRVLGVTQINDSVLDWLHAAIFGTGKIASPSFNEEGSFSSDEDDSDTGDDETLENKTIGDESPFLGGEYCTTQSICSSADNESGDSEKENEGSSQPVASFDIWDSESTAPSNKTLDIAVTSTTENTSQALEAAHSLSQLSHGDAPAAARPLTETKSGLPDDSLPSDRSASSAKRCQSHSYSSDDESIDLQHVSSKRRRFEDSYKPRKRAKSWGDLFFTISAVHIKRTSGAIEALEFDPEYRVWIDSEGVEYVSECEKFTASRVYWNMSCLLPYSLYFESEKK